MVAKGDVIGRWTVVELVGRGRSARLLCACGTSAVRALSQLERGLTKSCGCGRKIWIVTNGEHSGLGFKKSSPEWSAWSGMRRRCSAESDPGYKNYGGRGIRVCDRWLESFDNFLADMGRKPTPKHSIERIDNDGNYEPSNCRWATRIEQNQNTRRNVHVTINGETAIISEFARRFGIDPEKARTRMSMHGWTPEEAFGLVKRWKKICRLIEIDGTVRSIAEWCRHSGIPRERAVRALRCGITPREVFIGHVLKKCRAIS